MISTYSALDTQYPDQSFDIPISQSHLIERAKELIEPTVSRYVSYALTAPESTVYRRLTLERLLSRSFDSLIEIRIALIAKTLRDKLRPMMSSNAVCSYIPWSIYERFRDDIQTIASRRSNGNHIIYLWNCAVVRHGLAQLFEGDATIVYSVANRNMLN